MGVIGAGTVAEARGGSPSDVELVASVRAGDDEAFEELYRRYHVRIRAFVHKRLRDTGRAEDVTQEAFLSALRRIRATDADIAFKPWLFEIARNAAIDVYRRDSRTQEVPVDDAALASQSDRGRLASPIGPDIEVFAREQLELLSGAFDELPETHHRALVMRELEGRSYREIGERLELSDSAVESTLFRARRRLEHEYDELEAGRRCESARATAALLAEDLNPGIRGRRRFVRHTRRCLACRRHAMELGVATPSLRERAAALLPLPLILRRWIAGASASPESAGASGGALAGPGAHLGSGLVERAASLLAAVALAGAGGAALNGIGGAEPPKKADPGAAAPAATRPADPLRTRPKPDGASRPSTPERGAVTGPRRQRERPRAGTPQRREDFAPKPRAPRAQQPGAAPPAAGRDAGSSGRRGSPNLPRLQQPAPGLVPQVTNGVGSTLQRTTNGVGSTLQRTTNEVGSTLQRTTDGVGGGVNETVERTQPVVDATRRTVTDTTGAAGELVNGLTNRAP
jgi:RNA polymerase sigma factor (sigma-70 family)